MINQIYKLNMIPDKVPVMVRVSQYDQYSRTIIFDLYDGAIEYEIPTGSTITIRGTKPDKTGFEYPCTFSGNRVEFLLEPQVSVISGLVPAELRITSNNEIVGSCNFIFNVEETPLDKDTIISDTELPLIEEASQAAVIAQGAAARAEEEADRASQVLASAVKSVNNELPDSQGNVDVDTMPSGGTTGQILTKLSNNDGDVGWLDNNKVLVITTSSFSSLPQTITNSAITSNMVVVNSVLSNPSAQTEDWTVTTSNGSLTISGSISGSTTLTLYLLEQR